MTPKTAGVSILFDLWPDGGKSCGIYRASDVIEAYGHRVNDELDYEDVRTHYVETRKRPAKSLEEYLIEVPENYLAIILSSGWDESDKTTHNTAKIEYFGKESLSLGRRLSQTMYDWGKSYVFNHRSSEPRLALGSRQFIKIMPFALNGHASGEYLKKLDRLGADIGRTIGEYLRDTGQGLRR